MNPINALLGLIALLFGCSLVAAAEPAPLTLENVPGAKKIVADEPVRKSFSAMQAARYLDTASLDWQLSRNCVTCHTNMSYLMARPALSSVSKDSGEVRKFFESYYQDRWEEGKKLPKNNYDPVVVATALAFNDAQTSKKLADTTREALDFMWTTQGKDGAWNWPKCGWAPMEIDDHYGVTLAALTTGIAPGNYVGTDAAKAGLARARAYLKDNPAPSLHHRTMIAWASLRVGGLMEEAARKSVLEEVFSKQLPDGGWSTPALLIDWKEFKRKDGKPHDPDTSDAYATGLAIVFAREMGIAAKDERLQNGIAWLKNNQRESGMWFTRSPSKDNKHYFTNFGCAFAILGLQSCGELPGWPFAGGRE